MLSFCVRVFGEQTLCDREKNLQTEKSGKKRAVSPSGNSGRGNSSHASKFNSAPPPALFLPFLLAQFRAPNSRKRPPSSAQKRGKATFLFLRLMFGKTVVAPTRGIEARRRKPILFSNIILYLFSLELYGEEGSVKARRAFFRMVICGLLFSDGGIFLRAIKKGLLGEGMGRKGKGGIFFVCAFRLINMGLTRVEFAIRVFRYSTILRVALSQSPQLLVELYLCRIPYLLVWTQGARFLFPTSQRTTWAKQRGKRRNTSDVSFPLLFLSASIVSTR